MTRPRARLLLLHVLLAVGVPVTPCLAQSAAKVPPPGPSAQKPPAAPAAQPRQADSPEFERVVKAATEARQAERWSEAIDLYAKAIKLRPGYVEGHWYRGTAYYSLDDYARCREAFRQVIALAPKNGAAYAFLGLCEFG